MFVNFENETVGTYVADASTVDGVWIDTQGINGYIRNTISTPVGTKYIEWNCPANTTDVYWEWWYNYGGNPLTLVADTTYYLGTFVRFEKISGNDIWQDTASASYSFDKLIEMRGSGFRWGIASGWNGWYTSCPDHTFTFDTWYATSVLGEHGPDHIIADQSPYNAGNPYLCYYDKWYAVVIGVTARNDGNGRIQQWINGTKILDQSHYTMNSGATIEDLNTNGTIAQSGYDASAHKRQFDGIILTNSWTDIQNGGYLSDPEGNGGSPSQSHKGGTIRGGTVR
jgi:hypothetical protein